MGKFGASDKELAEEVTQTMTGSEMNELLLHGFLFKDTTGGMLELTAIGYNLGREIFSPILVNMKRPGRVTVYKFEMNIPGA